MNLSRIRDNYNLIAQSAEWFDKYGHIANNIDQDMLNSRFQRDIKVIESKFNNLHNHDGDISGTILHAIGFPKPWNGPKCEALDRLYWKTFLRTPWGRLTPEEVADLMLDVFKNSPMTHRHTGQCYRAVLSRIYKDVIRNDAVKTLVVIYKEFKHELTRSRRRSDA
jgi:lipopolysaccharide biosynthesis glycosyltransferase